MQFTPHMIGILMILGGALSVFCPQLAFFLDEGWKFRNVEPSNLFLLCARISGFVFIIFGVMILTDHATAFKPNHAETAAPSATQ